MLWVNYKLSKLFVLVLSWIFSMVTDSIEKILSFNQGQKKWYKTIMMSSISWIFNVWAVFGLKSPYLQRIITKPNLKYLYILLSSQPHNLRKKLEARQRSGPVHWQKEEPGGTLTDEMNVQVCRHRGRCCQCKLEVCLCQKWTCKSYILDVKQSKLKKKQTKKTLRYFHVSVMCYMHTSGCAGACTVWISDCESKVCKK